MLNSIKQKLVLMQLAQNKIHSLQARLQTTTAAYAVPAAIQI
jgi:hypothetical protein